MTPRKLAGSRIAVTVVCCVATMAGVTGCAASPPRSAVESALDAGPSRGSTEYVTPSPAAADEIAAAVTALADSQPASIPPAYTLAEQDGIQVLSEVPRDGRTAGWGVYAVNPAAPSPLVVEVPHPRSDRWTEDLGLDVFEAATARVLLVAGAHRTANDGAADPAHEPGTVFARVDDAVVRAGWTVLQLHGFAEANHDVGAEAVVSSTSPTPTAIVLDVADALTRRGITACVYDGVSCQGLGGTLNVQGAHARDVGADFIHLELADTVRADPARRADVVAALAEALGPR